MASDYWVELEAFWRSHHEAWRRSDLNRREYCESHGPVGPAVAYLKVSDSVSAGETGEFEEAIK
jgi:hypothetical protein